MSETCPKRHLRLFALYEHRSTVDYAAPPKSPTETTKASSTTKLIGAEITDEYLYPQTRYDSIGDFVRW